MKCENADCINNKNGICPENFMNCPYSDILQTTEARGIKIEQGKPQYIFYEEPSESIYTGRKMK